MKRGTAHYHLPNAKNSRNTRRMRPKRDPKGRAGSSHAAALCATTANDATPQWDQRRALQGAHHTPRTRQSAAPKGLPHSPKGCGAARAKRGLGTNSVCGACRRRPAQRKNKNCVLEPNPKDLAKGITETPSKKFSWRVGAREAHGLSEARRTEWAQLRARLQDVRRATSNQQPAIAARRPVQAAISSQATKKRNFGAQLPSSRKTAHWSQNPKGFGDGYH